MFRAFDHVHQGAEHRHQGAHADQEHHDLLLAAAQRGHQVVGLLEVRAELEHAEDAQHPDDADDQQILGVAVVQREDAGDDGEQVHQAIKAEGIAQRLGRAIQAQAVLDGEDQREAPLDIGQHVGVVLMDCVDAVEHHDHQAGEDDQQQDAVKAPPGDGVALEHHDVEALAPVVVAVHKPCLKRISSKPRAIRTGCPCEACAAFADRRAPASTRE